MKESYGEDFANHSGPESYAGDGNIAGVATKRQGYSGLMQIPEQQSDPSNATI